MESEKAIGGSPVGNAGAGLAELPDSAMMDLAALALALGCCQRTARRMVRRRELPPPIKLGRRSVWTAGRLRAWLDRRAEGAEAEAEKELARIHRIGT